MLLVIKCFLKTNLVNINMKQKTSCVLLIMITIQDSPKEG
jgi:hypothetical protein